MNQLHPFFFAIVKMNPVLSSYVENMELKPSTINLVEIAKNKKRKELVERRNASWGTPKFRRYKLRTWIQTLFTFICIWLGIELYFFAKYALMTDGIPLPNRPSGVDGFLPITGLMGLYDWFHMGTLNTIHPAATILIIVFIAISFLIRKTFCSWICPVGLFSEFLAGIGRKLFKRNYRLHKWVDIPLRSLKYIILFFFVGSIFLMGKEGVHQFLHSPYNKVADVKMGYFFVQLEVVGITVMTILTIASIFVYNFWCRYLCPYGALLGFFSSLSPLRVTRNESACTNCGFCDKVCPSNLPVMSKVNIKSVECTGCFDCVASCPVPAALNPQVQKRKISIHTIAVSVVMLFLTLWMIAKLFGVWDNQISDYEYRILLRNMDQFTHPGR